MAAQAPSLNYRIVSIHGPQSVERSTLEQAARLKGRKTAIEDCSGSVGVLEHTPSGKIRLCGFWPAVQYLEERHPAPTLFPGDCINRGVMRSVAHTLLHGDGDLHLFTSSTTRFLTGNYITLIDLIVYNLVQSQPRLRTPFWERHARYVEDELDAAEPL